MTEEANAFDKIIQDEFRGASPKTKEAVLRIRENLIILCDKILDSENPGDNLLKIFKK